MMSPRFDGQSELFTASKFVPRVMPDWLVWEHMAGNAMLCLASIAMPMIIWRLGHSHQRVESVPAWSSEPSRFLSA